jgi:hypothetical protein
MLDATLEIKCSTHDAQTPTLNEWATAGEKTPEEPDIEHIRLPLLREFRTLSLTPLAHTSYS